ncbi:MAG TPA: hypothetical protein VKA87_11220 [Nitrososphaeraceae archaeon]|nr:hypothetical protein [Nitrososphaeraceae archaeon]
MSEGKNNCQIALVFQGGGALSSQPSLSRSDPANKVIILAMQKNTIIVY